MDRFLATKDSPRQTPCGQLKNVTGGRRHVLTCKQGKLTEMEVDLHSTAKNKVL